MVTKSEQVVQVDADDTELGIISRVEAHEKGIPHRIVVVYVVNKKGDILIQERLSGRLDHSAAGHVDPGEDYLTAAQRELSEELGIVGALTEVGKVLADEIEPEVGGTRIRHMEMVYSIVAEPGRLEPEEVKSVYWADPQQVYSEMQRDPGNEKYCGGFKVSLKLYLAHVTA